MTFAELAAEVARLDAVLAPIAHRPVDIADPRWADRLVAGPAPMDEAGVRGPAEAALRELLHRYAEGDAETRAALRDLLRRHPSFRWAVHLPDADLRTQLIHLSLRDQGSDTRDELLALQALCADARRAGVDVGAVLAQVAEMSSDVDHYGMGSMRDILLRYSN
jgi:hypothetical protein